MTLEILNRTDPNKGNCVYYAKARVPNNFSGLWFLSDKKKMINTYTPSVGSIAIMNVGYNYVNPSGVLGFSGHMGVVTAINGDIITIEEANYIQGAVTRRTGTLGDLRIVGFYNPKPSPASQPAPSGFPKQITVTANPFVYVRTQPNTSAPLGGSQKLYKGTVITVVGQVQGQNVSGNSIWYISVRGNYVWSGGFN